MSRLFVFAAGLLSSLTVGAIITAYLNPALGCLAGIILIGAALLCAIAIIWSAQP